MDYNRVTHFCDRAHCGSWCWHRGTVSGVQTAPGTATPKGKHIEIVSICGGSMWAAPFEGVPRSLQTFPSAPHLRQIHPPIVTHGLSLPRFHSPLRAMTHLAGGDEIRACTQRAELPMTPLEAAAPPPAPPVPLRQSTKAKEAGTTNFKKRGYNALMTAIASGDTEQAKALIVAGAGVNERTNKGWTPLMLACMAKSEALAELLLQHGALASIHVRSTGQMTATDYARLHGLSRLAARLLELEISSKASLRCPICSEVFNRKSKLEYIRETVHAGTEGNELVRQFCALEEALELEKPQYHRLNSQKTLRKEITETMSIVNVLQAILRKREAPAARRGSGPGGGLQEGASTRLHIIDLCCGKSLTGCFLALVYPQFVIHTVDLISPASLPHYPEPPVATGDGTDGAGSDGGGKSDSNPYARGGLRYLQRNLFDAGFVDAMDALIRSVNLPTCVLGMHLCGHLSSQAIAMTQRTELITDLVLSPCCLPSKAHPSSRPEWYASPEPDAQYAQWVGYLCDQITSAARSSGGGGGDGQGGSALEVSVSHEPRMLTSRCALIHARRPGSDRWSGERTAAAAAAVTGGGATHPTAAVEGEGVKSRSTGSEAQGKSARESSGPAAGGGGSAGGLFASWSVHTCAVSVLSASDARGCGRAAAAAAAAQDWGGAKGRTLASLPPRTFEPQAASPQGGAGAERGAGGNGGTPTLAADMAAEAFEQGGRVRVTAVVVNRGTSSGSRNVTAHMTRRPAGVTCVRSHAEWAAGHPIFFGTVSDVPPAGQVPLVFDVTAKHLRKLEKQAAKERADDAGIRGSYVIRLSDSDGALELTVH